MPAFLMALFRWLKLIAPEPDEKPRTEIPQQLPHEPQLRDDSRTLANTNINDVLERWFNEWQVPEKYQSYWRRFKIIVSLEYGIDVPAATSSETNKMWIRPEWANPGVIAHELAHESYSLLNKKKKADFALKNDALKNTDGMMIYLYSHVEYAGTNIIEGHAEIYRYLGDQMPLALKKYYPKLMK